MFKNEDSRVYKFVIKNGMNLTKLQKGLQKILLFYPDLNEFVYELNNFLFK
jgi:hypothetical protein